MPITSVILVSVKMLATTDELQHEDIVKKSGARMCLLQYSVVFSNLESQL